MRNILTALLFLLTADCYSQISPPAGDAKKVIISFFREIQNDTIDAGKIWPEFIWFDTQNELNVTERIKIFAEHVQSLRSQKCTKCAECQNCKFDFDDKTLYIKKLEDVNIDHLNFSQIMDYQIYVIVQRNQILQYVSVRDEKIAGFYTIKSTKEEGNSMFLGY